MDTKIIALNKMLNIITLNIMTLNITTLSKMTPGITTLSTNDTQHNDTQYNDTQLCNAYFNLNVRKTTLSVSVKALKT
jgi:hypothetical protein